MITIFNRKEVCTTFGMKDQARVREVLAANNIDYKYKVVNRMSSSSFSAGSRSRVGAIGQDLEKMYQYYIYVHKKDYDQALCLIKKDR